MKYYVLVIWQDIEPTVCGPYSTEEERDQHAKAFRKNGGDKHGYYRMDCEADCAPIVQAYPGSFFDE